MSKEEKLDHIKMIEFTQNLGSYNMQRAAVLDDRLVSEKEVKDCIVRGEAYHPCIIYMYIEQFENVFRSDGTMPAEDHGERREGKNEPSDALSAAEQGNVSMTIEDLGLPLRAYNALKRKWFMMVGQLLNMPRHTNAPTIIPANCQVESASACSNSMSRETIESNTARKEEA